MAAKRAAIYCRVSTQDQSDHGYSLPAQAEACREYCRRNGLEVVAEFSEDVSGTVAMHERAQGALLVGMFAHREVDAVVTHAVDRYSRDFADMCTYLRDWYNAGIELHAIDAGKARGSTDISWVMQGWKAAEDWKRIRKNTMNGRRRKAQEGKIVGAGRPPYGYRYARDGNGKVQGFEIVPDEAEVVRLIFTWYVRGDGENGPLSTAKIAERLTGRDIPAPGDVRPGYNRRLPGAWKGSQILTMLKRETYCGVWHYDAGTIDGATGERLREREDFVIGVPGIVSRELWDAAQQRRSTNRKYAKRNAKRDYLLSGMVRCSCGLAMSGSSSSSPYSTTRAYYCTWQRARPQEPRPPHRRHVLAEHLETAVWDSLAGLFRDLLQLESLLRRAQQEEEEATTPKRQDLETVMAALGEAEQQAASIARAIMAASGAVGQALQQQAEIVNMRHAALVKRRDELAAALANPTLTDEAIRDTVRFAADVRAGLDNADFRQKRYILETLRVEVTVKEGRFYVECLAGSWDGDIARPAKGTGARIATDSLR